MNKTADQEKKKRRNGRMSRETLCIGAYYLAPYACSEKHIQELADCGVQMIIGMKYDPEVLDLFQKYGLGAVVTGILPGWFGGRGEQAGMLEQVNPLEKYRMQADQYADHPAVWGIDIGDEPSALDFPYYGRVYELVRERFPKLFPYLNIYPSYGMQGTNTPEEIRAQLGTERYREYIKAYCEHVDSDYISVDYYLYSADISGLYKTLSVVSEACAATGRSMWAVLQVNSHQKDRWISTRQLQVQAYAALAFGAEAINWACYTAGWWYNHVLDEKGNKTQQYEKLKEVNGQLQSVGKEYMKYRHVCTYFVGNFTEEELEAAGQRTRQVLDTEAFRELHTLNGEKLLIGLRRKKSCLESAGDGEDVGEALMLCWADDSCVAETSETEQHRVTAGRNMAEDFCEERDSFGKDSSCKVRFKTAYRNITALGERGPVPVYDEGDGVYSLEMHSWEGVFIYGTV